MCSNVCVLMCECVSPCLVCVAMILMCVGVNFCLSIIIHSCAIKLDPTGLVMLAYKLLLLSFCSIFDEYN